MLFSSVRAADTLFRQVTTAYGSPHEHRVVSPAGLPTVPGEGYEKVRAELSSLGFRYMGSLENLTMVMRAWSDIST